MIVAPFCCIYRRVAKKQLRTDDEVFACHDKVFHGLTCYLCRLKFGWKVGISRFFLTHRATAQAAVQHISTRWFPVAHRVRMLKLLNLQAVKATFEGSSVTVCLVKAWATNLELAFIADLNELLLSFSQILIEFVV